MGQLYEKMASDLKLRRYSARTQESYLWCAQRFVRHYMRSPAEMGSKEIREFLLRHHNRGASASTIKMYVAGLRFLYAVTLGRPAEVQNIPWPRAAQKLPAVIDREHVQALLAKLEPLKYRMVVMTAYGKAPFRTPDALFHYLGLYTHRVAISNHRILSVDDESVTFRTRDKKVCQLDPLEFIRRFLLHILPWGFVKIRHFGLYAAGNVNSKLAVARAAIDSHGADGEMSQTTWSAVDFADVDSLDWRKLFHRLTGIDLLSCPSCGCHLTSTPLTRSSHAS